jgi:predicted aldo/keto reductase-like oxidoreductase
MQYRTDIKSGNKLSILGFGCMRFPRNFTQIDTHKTEQLIVKAVQEGINYFDTAYIYAGSEDALGQIIQKNNLRNKIFLATKLPYSRCTRYEDFDNLFNAQLERLHTNYFDYYLLHNLSDTVHWESLRKLGIEKWINEKKISEQIKNIGFSFHGAHDEFSKLLDIYDWDFCQIQYNYFNPNYQAGTAGLKKAASKGLSVIIMEPLLGGKLANGLPKRAVDVFKSANNSLSPAAWALRWLWNQKEVTVVLSGMNEDSQLQENLEIANDAMPDMLTVEDGTVFDSVMKIIKESYKVPCTGCNYCMPCPHDVNIPACFAAYNTSYTVGLLSGLSQYMSNIAVTHSRSYAASQCKKCGKCEKKCPQHIQIIKSLEKVSRRMEPFWFKCAARLALKLPKIKK